MALRQVERVHVREFKTKASALPRIVQAVTACVGAAQERGRAHPCAGGPSRSSMHAWNRGDETGMKKTGLVVSAHSADFVWRAGGAIALHAVGDIDMHVACLSFGERGESEKLWRQK